MQKITANAIFDINFKLIHYIFKDTITYLLRSVSSVLVTNNNFICLFYLGFYFVYF
jgi:hypothetical protein